MLLNTDLDHMTYEAVEKYMRRCAFFGLFPSMFSSDAYHNRYLDAPEYYDRDRLLFKEYIPITLDMAKAGWHPVTHARCPNTAIRIERFGEGPLVFLSTLNAAPQASQPAEITFDRQAWAFSMDIPPDDVVVLRLH